MNPCPPLVPRPDRDRSRTRVHVLGRCLDRRRIRANVHLDLEGAPGFTGDSYVGAARLRIGPKAVVHVLERDPRCAMITIDPDTAERDPTIQRRLSHGHGGMAGVYAAVHEGNPRKLRV